VQNRAVFVDFWRSGSIEHHDSPGNFWTWKRLPEKSRFQENA